MKFGKMAGLAAIGVFALAGALATPGISQASAVHSSAAPLTRAEAYAVQIRAQLGLKSSLPYIRSLESEHGLNDTQLGTPVTAAELAELTARHALGSHVNAVGKTLSASPSFGGVWFKQAGDGVIMVGLTSAPTAAVTRMVSRDVPAHSAVDFVRVPLSYRRLNSLYQKIIAGPMWARGIGNVAIDLAANTVTVGVATKADVRAVYARYGHTGLTVTVAAPTAGTASRNFTSGQLYGGEWVSFANGESCTMGYGDLINAAGQLYSMTAGHCAPNGTAAYQGNAIGDPTIGSGMHGGHTYNQPNKTTQCDCGFVGVITGNQLSDQTLVTNNALFTFTQTGTAYSGESSCHSGAASYEKNGGHIVCGTIVSTSATVSVTGTQAGTFTLTNSIEWSGSEILGDSGAPLGDGGNFLGIASATNGSDAWFSKSTNVKPVTGLTLEY